MPKTPTPPETPTPTLTPALRTGGLWDALPPEELRDLLLLLTFLTSNGRVRPTLLELADAMKATVPAARARMERLAHRQWRGAPLAVPLPVDSGLNAYSPGHQLIGREETPPGTEGRPGPSPTAGREAVLAYSRARYARTRTEVEAEINQRMGWGPPAFDGDDPDVAARKGAAYEKLTVLGTGREQAMSLLSQFDLDRVERQVDWIGRRGAKNLGMI